MKLPETVGAIAAREARKRIDEERTARSVQEHPSQNQIGKVLVILEEITEQLMRIEDKLTEKR